MFGHLNNTVPFKAAQRFAALILGQRYSIRRRVELSNPRARGGRLEEARAYASDIGVLGVLRGLSRLRGLILLPIIARSLGPSVYGAWTQSLVAVAVGSSLVLVQVDTALVRFVSGTNDRAEQQRIYLPLLLLVTLLGVLVSFAGAALARPLASFVLGDSVYEPVAAWLGLWAAITALGQLGIQLQRGLHRVKLYGFLSTGETLGQMVVVAVVILSTGNLLFAVLGAVIWESIFVLGVLALGFRSVGLGRPDFATLSRSLGFSLPLVPSYYAGMVLSFGDRVYIAAQLGAEAVGIYAAAYSLARIVGEIFIPVSTALLPAVSRAWDGGDRTQTRWLLSNTLRYYLFLAIPSVAGLGLLGPGILQLLAPGTFNQGIGPLIGLLGLGYLFGGLQTAFAIVLQLVEATRSLAVSRGLAAIVYLPAVFLGVSGWGLLGGAAATVIGYAVDMSLAFVFSARYERFELPVRYSLKAVVATSAMAVLVWFLARPGLAGLASSLVAGALTYVVLLILLRGIGRREFSWLISVVRKGPSMRGNGGH